MINLDADDRAVIVDEINDLNDTLVTYSINLTGQAFFNAFKLGAGLMIIPLGIVLAIAYRRETFDFTTVFVFSCIATLLAMVFAALIASRAKVLAVRDNYEDEIGPKIELSLKRNQITRVQFNALADEVLDKDAPLREYVAPASVGLEE